MTRTGKIARLPRHIRDELNCRLDDGEQGVRLVEWLNQEPDVKRVLNMDFGGRPINEQNLSDWKQGGYLDWRQAQTEQDRVLLMAEAADQIADDAGLMQLTDRIATMAALSLAKIISDLGPKALSDKEALRDFLRVLRELARLRGDDLKAATMLDCYARNAAKRRKAQTPPPAAVPESSRIKPDQTKNENENTHETLSQKPGSRRSEGVSPSPSKPRTQESESSSAQGSDQTQSPWCLVQQPQLPTGQSSTHTGPPLPEIDTSSQARSSPIKI